MKIRVVYAMAEYRILVMVNNAREFLEGHVNTGLYLSLTTVITICEDG
jgi:hypothetical protein